MRLSNLVTSAYYHANNFLHILLDNNSHDSTGGQSTLSSNVNFGQIAAAAGFENVYFCHNLQEFSQRVSEWHNKPQPTFLHLQVQKGSKKNLGRPKIKPYEVRARIMEFINS